MIEQVKELRVQIDGLTQLTKELIIQNPSISPTGEYIAGMRKPIDDEKYFLKSKEIEKSVDSLLLAKAWLGKVLAELGTESPYKSGYKEVKDIEPTADVANHNDKVSVHYHLPYTEMNHIEKVDWLRSSITDTIQQVINLELKGARELAIARTNSYTHLCESKIYLGFELSRIRDIK